MSMTGSNTKVILANTMSCIWFIYKCHPNVKHKEWGVLLPYLQHTWTELCVKGILQPGHNASTFLRHPNSSIFDPVAIFFRASISMKNASSLLQALTDAHPDRYVWIQSYYEGKESTKSMGTFLKLSLGEYRALWEKGAPWAILSMCVLTIKKDENILSLLSQGGCTQACSRIC